MTEIHFPGVRSAAAGVLGSLGLDVVPLEGATCCGQAFYNSGHPDMARKVGRNLFYAIEASDDPIIMLSGSCAHFVREHYPRLFGIGMGIDEVCFEFTEFITRIAGVDIKGSLGRPLKAAYHPACHLLRGLKIKDEPINLLSEIENLELLRINKEETCCGFGGVFSAIYPEVSSTMADEKVRAIRDAGADVVVSADAGCLRRMEKNGIKAMHIAELLWMGMKR
jgi:L-lactate dehydrogenase complex protein LldE